jgi:hypothetical protein
MDSGQAEARCRIAFAPCNDGYTNGLLHFVRNDDRFLKRPHSLVIARPQAVAIHAGEFVIARSESDAATRFLRDDSAGTFAFSVSLSDAASGLTATDIDTPVEAVLLRKQALINRRTVPRQRTVQK